jgi:multicomponent K+:H+ antiporter subunit E
MQSVFITVPVDTDHPFVVNLLASIITMTPGTVSARVNEPTGGGRAAIVVHALDCDDPDALIEEIKTRYEQPLREIFKC